MIFTRSLLLGHSILNVFIGREEIDLSFVWGKGNEYLQSNHVRYGDCIILQGKLLRFLEFHHLLIPFVLYKRCDHIVMFLGTCFVTMQSVNDILNMIKLRFPYRTKSRK